MSSLHDEFLLQQVACFRTRLRMAKA